MDHRRLKVLLLGGFLMSACLFSAVASAETSIDRRQDRQHKRIQRGIADGSLTPRETRRLERQEGRIQAREDRFLADGSLSRREKTNLNRSLNRVSRHIYRARHNKQHL